MTFVSPSWWWALVGLAVPLVVHLLSRGRRQRVRLGTVRHLQGADSRALRSLRLTSWPQLLLRLLLLVVLTLALAGPRWPIGDSSGRGRWLLLDPDLASALPDLGVAGDPARAVLDEARADGAALRWLATGLPAIDDGEPPAQRADLWSLLREADGAALPSTEFTVLTLDRVGMLAGRRPHLARQIDWQTVTDTRANRWIERIELGSEGDRSVVVGLSSSLGSRFDRHSWTRDENPPQESGLRWDAQRGTVEIDGDDPWPLDDVAALPEQPGSLRLRMSVAPERTDDAWYLRRAAEAVGGYLGRGVEWIEDSTAPVDLSVGLGMAPSPSSGGVRTLTDAETPFAGCAGVAMAESIRGGVELELRRCASGAPTADAIGWWLDGWGEPFLERGPEPGEYRLRGRFDPRWSTLVSSAALPRLLLELLGGEKRLESAAGNAQSDRRASTGWQRLPGQGRDRSAPSGRSSELPEQLAWVAVALLLAVERWLSWRTG